MFTTVAAISTPPGKGGVGLIRISGDRSLEIAEKLFVPRNGKPLSEHPPRVQMYGNILAADGKTVLDDGLLTYFQGPHSFTGEDVVEISCHGGEIVTSMVLSAVLESGADMAEAGEFSRRAFLNGKLSLTAAEGVADLLDAKTEAAALLSSSTARGKLSEKLNGISERILSLSASLWAYIDYPDEDLQSVSDEEMLSALKEIEGLCEALIESYQIGRAVNSGVNAVIVGKPNAGKSTFFNALLGERKAIVSEAPGTTRDRIEYPLKVGKVLLNLSDTAGLRGHTEDSIEKMGMELVSEALEEAELVFALFDSSKELDSDDKMVLKKLEGKAVKIIPVVTKCDLEKRLDLKQMEHLGEPICVTNQEEMDFSVLIQRIESWYLADETLLKEGGVLTNMRQLTHLTKTRNLIREAAENVRSGAKDIASLTLERALAELNETDGKSAGERILNEVFSRFCIGK